MWLLTSCLLPNRASFAPACLSHEIIIRRSVPPALGQLVSMVLDPDICNAPIPSRPAQQPPQLWLLLRVFKTTCTTSCVARSQWWQCHPLLWQHPSDPNLGFCLQPLDRRPGEGDLAAPGAALLGPKPPRQPQGQQSPPEGLPHPPGGQLPLAPLQPLMPHHPGPIHGAGDECGPVPDAHGLRRADGGTAAGPGAQ